jgi:hypothetical protein
MRARLPHPLAERRHARRHRARATLTTTPSAARLDTSLARARQAGGPVDRASYACQCGYLFQASVSTSVTCPHCGCGQAW